MDVHASLNQLVAKVPPWPAFCLGSIGIWIIGNYSYIFLISPPYSRLLGKDLLTVIFLYHVDNTKKLPTSSLTFNICQFNMPV